MIAIISDSHIPNRAEKIPEEFLEKLEEADEAVHCGDFETEEKYRELKQKYGIIGVKGNCDFFDIPVSEKFEKSDIRFGVYHGAGINPRGHHPTLARTAEKLGVEALFTGHTHKQEVAEHENKILLNPGSCTGVGGGSATQKNPSMITVEILENKGLEVKILEKNLETGEISVEDIKIMEL